MNKDIGKRKLTETDDLRLSRVISAPPDRVFDLWTRPDELKKWWGPANVRCISAEVDLRVGGAYRIGNEMPDGTIVWISGLFRRIERPNRLEYSWSVESGSKTIELVTVDFTAHEHGTMLTLVHSRIANEALREGHRLGWIGCLDGLGQLAREMLSRTPC